MEHEDDGDTKSNARNRPYGFEEKNEGIGIQRKNRDHVFL